MAKPSPLSFRRGSPAYRKRSEIAEAIHRDNPSMPKSRKFAIATAATKKRMRSRRKGY